jgi:stearoyl-CoA desaturase (delta-9 desaturase)
MFTSSTKGAQIFQAISFLGSAIAIYFYEISLGTLLLILLGYFLYGCLGIVVTFHRYLTHQSFKTYPILIKLFSILGCFSGTGSPLSWVAIHINHHLNSDKHSDPHSPLHKGIKIFSLNYIENVSDTTKWRMRNLVTDKFQQFLHRYYFLINIVYSLILFIIGGFYLMIFFHWLPAVITALMSNVVNYAGHSPQWLGGYRTYNLSDQSANNWLWAIPSWGESWHNNHHRFPKDFTFKKQWWEFDVSGLIINIIRIND